MIKIKRLLVLVACILFLMPGSSAQNTAYVLNYYKTNYIFGSGYWVYQDTATLETDSVTLENIKHGFYGPNPAVDYIREYYQMEYYHHSTDSSSNDFFIEYLWRVNGGGQWAELGQPVMVANNSGPLMGGYNGFEILELFDSLVVGDNTFYNVARSHVYENQQYQYEFNYSTDLFYAEDVGIIRKTYTDNEGVNHCLDLVNWEVGLYTEINDNEPLSENIVVFPNPSSGYFNVIHKQPVRIELCTLQGKVILESPGREIDITGISDGIYIARIYSEKGILLKAEKIIKHSY